MMSYRQRRPRWPDSAAAPTDSQPVSESRSRAGPCAGNPSACGDTGSLEAPGSPRDTGPARRAGLMLRH